MKPAGLLLLPFFAVLLIKAAEMTVKRNQEMAPDTPNPNVNLMFLRMMGKLFKKKDALLNFDLSKQTSLLILDLVVEFGRYFRLALTSQSPESLSEEQKRFDLITLPLLKTIINHMAPPIREFGTWCLTEMVKWPQPQLMIQKQTVTRLKNIMASRKETLGNRLQAMEALHYICKSLGTSSEPLIKKMTSSQEPEKLRCKAFKYHPDLQGILQLFQTTTKPDLRQKCLRMLMAADTHEFLAADGLRRVASLGLRSKNKRTIQLTLRLLSILICSDEGALKFIREEAALLGLLDHCQNKDIEVRRLVSSILENLSLVSLGQKDIIVFLLGNQYHILVLKMIEWNSTDQAIVASGIKALSWLLTANRRHCPEMKRTIRHLVKANALSILEPLNLLVKEIEPVEGMRQRLVDRLKLNK